MIGKKNQRTNKISMIIIIRKFIKKLFYICILLYLLPKPYIVTFLHKHSISMYHYNIIFVQSPIGHNTYTIYILTPRINYAAGLVFFNKNIIFFFS